MPSLRLRAHATMYSASIPRSALLTRSDEDHCQKPSKLNSSSDPFSRSFSSPVLRVILSMLSSLSIALQLHPEGQSESPPLPLLASARRDALLVSVCGAKACNQNIEKHSAAGRFFPTPHNRWLC